MTESNMHSNPDETTATTETPADLTAQEDAREDGQDVIGASAPGAANTTEKDPADWATGDEPMTGAQRSYLDTLARDAGETLDAAEMTKAEASQHIDRLQSATGRGTEG